MLLETSLARFRPGERGLLLRVDGERPFRRRLMELGLTPGVEVTLLKVAPLGDPLELEARGCRLSIRRAEAGQVFLSPLPHSHPFTESQPALGLRGTR